MYSFYLKKSFTVSGIDDFQIFDKQVSNTGNNDINQFLTT